MRKYLNQIKSNPLFLFILALMLFYFSSFYPSLTERFYSQGIFRMIVPTYSRITGLFPFSIAELIIGILIVTILFSLGRLFKSSARINFKYLKKVIFVFSLIYFLFITTWGINYNRYTFAQIAQLEIKPATVEELTSLTENLIIKVNELRALVLEDDQRVMKLPNGIPNMFQRASEGFKRAGEVYPELSGTYGKPKGVLFSEVMAYLGIGGFYFPFTAEANINTLLPPPMLPFVTAHEMAHQRGFAREDEANYLAYLTTSKHPDVDFQYSGHLMALSHAMSALRTAAPEKALALQEQYSEGVKRDLIALNQYWQKYDTFLDTIATEINNLFLRANMQQDGVDSYSRMIDLLLAEYREKNKGNL